MPEPRDEPRFTDADMTLIVWLIQQEEKDSAHVLPFPPEEELRLKRLESLARLERKVKAVRRYRRRAAAPPPF